MGEENLSQGYTRFLETSLLWGQCFFFTLLFLPQDWLMDVEFLYLAEKDPSGPETAPLLLS